MTTGTMMAQQWLPWSLNSTTASVNNHLLWVLLSFSLTLKETKAQMDAYDWLCLGHMSCSRRPASKDGRLSTREFPLKGRMLTVGAWLTEIRYMGFYPTVWAPYIQSMSTYCLPHIGKNTYFSRFFAFKFYLYFFLQ